MADFLKAFALTMKAEGGYVNDPVDPGGETYKGIARKMNPGWEGWKIVDMLKGQKRFPANLDGYEPLQEKIVAFYRANYWDRVCGDKITNQDVAESIFDFAVNAGVVASVKVAQVAARATVDGVIGPVTLSKINGMDPRVFLAFFSLGKIARYVSICEKRKESRKYLFGWIKRALEGV
jgi:lysozyme family protein